MPSEVLLDPCRTWCPSSSCQAVCQVKEAESPALPQLVRCSVCTLEFCSACKANWHPGQACQESNLPITSFLPGENRLEGLKFKRVKSVDPGGNGSFKPGADERLDRTCFSAISSYCGNDISATRLQWEAEPELFGLTNRNKQKEKES